MRAIKFSSRFGSNQRNVNAFSICSGQSNQVETDIFICTRAAYLRIQQSIIKKCAEEKALFMGLASHAQLLHFGLQSDTLTSNMLINMYSKCGVVGYAQKVFDKMPVRTVVSWNTLIGAYAVNNIGEGAVHLFFRMLREGSQLSEFALSSVLCGCASKALASESKQLHAFAIKLSMELNKFVSTALLDVYAKCGFIEDAFRVFEVMPEKSDVTWSSMMAGLVRNELYHETLSLFQLALRTDKGSNVYMISSVISACASMAALIQGKQVYAAVYKIGFSSNEYIVSSLVDMYAKCGSIRESYAVFIDSEAKNVVLWNTIISAFARHARSMEAMMLFEKMQQMFLLPNEITYISLLSACAHLGMAEEGRKYFGMMNVEHGLSPNVLHYACLVDVFCRSGQLKEAKDLIDTMPFEPTPSIWGSLLGSCRVFRNVELAELAASKLLEIEPNNAGNLVLLSNIYAANGRWEDVASARKLLKDTEAKKERGQSWIEIKDKVHWFTVGEISHPNISLIYSKLDELIAEMEEVGGFRRDTEHDIHDVDEEFKKELLKHHSEKLAFAYGIMCLPSGAVVRIMKNLRICGDCHEFMKVASSVTNREIVVRDNNRFHHFCEGRCSCGDFW